MRAARVNTNLVPSERAAAQVTIGLDLRATEPDFKAHYGRGTGRYTEELVRALLRLQVDGVTGGIQLQGLKGDALRGHTGVRKFVQALPFGRMTVETQLLLPYQLWTTHKSFVHFFSHGDAPAWSPVPYLVTVLDLIPLRFPELYRANRPNWRFRLARYLENRAVKSAAGIFAISQATKRDLVELLGVPEERIVVTPLAVGPEFRAATNVGTALLEMKSRLKLELELPQNRPMLLYVGGVDPRKNVPFLLKAFSEVLRSSADNTTEKPFLVLVGKYSADDNFPLVLSTIKELGLENDIKLAGFVSDALLPKYYQAATLSVFPSLYEGFGFPVLESMASGVPVIAGNNSSMPEVGGGGAVLLPDNELAVWVKEIEALLASSERQLALAEKGIVSAGEFSWERTARLTVQGYEFFARN